MPRRHRVLAALSCAAGLIVSSHVRAQSVATPLDPVVVTAARTPQSLSDALPATTVVTRADIDDSHAPDLATLLRGRAGFDVAQQGGVGSQTSLFLRGSNSNQVLVLVDGMRINAVGSGAAAVAHLMIDQIERVEIVRGNVSALYGSEAIGGVVQIFTRGGSAAGDALGAAASATIGSERTRAASADVHEAFGPADARTRFGVAASYRAQKGFSAIDADRVATANPDADGYRNASVSANVAQRFGDHEIGLRYFESHGHLDFDESTDYGYLGRYDGRVETQAERSRQTDAAAYGRFVPLGFWTIDVSAARARDLSANTASFASSFVIGSTTSTQRQYRFGNTLRLDAHVVTAAYERLDQAGFSTAYGADGNGATFSRRVDSVMVGYTGPLFLPATYHEVQIDGRHDRYADFGDANTGLVAYGLKFAPGWKAIVEASTAFKAPSFNELYFPFYGNPALKAERARSFEAALQYAAADSLARVSAFVTHSRNLIVFDPLLALANNVARARTRGIEFSGRTVLDGWQLTADVTFARPVDEETGQRLLRRATRNADFAVAKQFGAWRLTADVQAAGARPDTDIVTFGPTVVGGYGVVNAGVRYDATRNVRIGAAVTNALDRRYALIDGYETAGRVAMLTVEARY